MSHYKNNRTLSILPIQAHFNSTKYKTKKPVPLNNTYVCIKGFLEDIETDSNGYATLFHVSVDNINFLGRAALTPSVGSSTGKYGTLSLLDIRITWHNSTIHTVKVLALQIQLRQCVPRLCYRYLSPRDSLDQRYNALQCWNIDTGRKV